jgi:hypothetical protein
MKSGGAYKVYYIYELAYSVKGLLNYGTYFGQDVTVYTG